MPEDGPKYFGIYKNGLYIELCGIIGKLYGFMKKFML